MPCDADVLCMCLYHGAASFCAMCLLFSISKCLNAIPLHYGGAYDGGLHTDDTIFMNIRFLLAMLP